MNKKGANLKLVLLLLISIIIVAIAIVWVIQSPAVLSSQPGKSKQISSPTFALEKCTQENCGFSQAAIDEKCPGWDLIRGACIVSREFSGSTLKLIAVTSGQSYGNKILSVNTAVVNDYIQLDIGVEQCLSACPTLLQQDKIIVVIPNAVQQNYTINPIFHFIAQQNTNI